MEQREVTLQSPFANIVVTAYWSVTRQEWDVSIALQSFNDSTVIRINSLTAAEMLVRELQKAIKTAQELKADNPGVTA